MAWPAWTKNLTYSVETKRKELFVVHRIWITLLTFGAFIIPLSRNRAAFAGTETISTSVGFDPLAASTTIIVIALACTVLLALILNCSKKHSSPIDCITSAAAVPGTLSALGLLTTGGA